MGVSAGRRSTLCRARCRPASVSLVNPAAGELFSLAVSAVFGVGGYGVFAEAYLRLADEPDGGEGAGTPAPEADPAA